MTDDLKLTALVQWLKSHDPLMVAFSGGVDSTFLLYVAHRLAGARILAVTARSSVYPRSEEAAAMALAREIGAPHRVLDFDALADPGFVANPPDRCYHCKRRLLTRLRELADREGVPVIVHGANMDDLGDYRPGFAAARELGVLAPLVDTGFSKAEIRRVSRRLGLSTWDKPAMACLATRVPYGEPITETALAMIADAEAVLHREGFAACRVRHHGPVARIEVPPDRLPAFLASEVRERIATALRRVGFTYVALDLEGYAQGRMNREVTATADDRSGDERLDPE